MSGPLIGTKVVELAGLGPGPHAAMLLGDLGADVLRIERPTPSAGAVLAGDRDDLLRNRRSLTLDLKSDAGREDLLALVEHADVLIEGLRPGVVERLGVGPEVALARNPRLVFGRVTGWGQHGPRSHTAGHDLTYLATTGMLHAMGPVDQPPSPPLNLVADFGSGSMFLVVGILSALVERQQSGRGQVIDAAMVDGVGVLGHAIWAMRGAGTWSDARSSNLLDGGAPFYACYACSDGRYVAVGAIEPQFYALLLDRLGITDADRTTQYDQRTWPGIRQRIASAIATRSRDEWDALFADTDGCVAGVLTFEEAARADHAVARDTYVDLDGVVQARPAPRFSRTPQGTPVPPTRTPQVTRDEVIAGWAGSTAPSDTDR